MPADQRLWPDDRDRIGRSRAEPVEPDERQPIRIGQPHAPGRLPSQNVQLMAQKQDLGLKPAARLGQRNQPVPQQSDRPEHGTR
jgi:hypothetical protein